MKLIPDLKQYVTQRQANRSDAAFAEELKLHPNTLYQFRHGITKGVPTKLVAALGVGVAYLEPEAILEPTSAPTPLRK